MKETETLNIEISYFTSGKLDKKIKHIWQSHIKKQLPLILGIIIFGVNKLLCLNSLFLLILSGGLIVKKLVCDIKNEFKDAFRPSEINKTEEEQPIGDIDFFTEKYKYDLMFEKSETYEEKKYKEILKKQQEEKKPYIKLIRDESDLEELENILTKEEVMEGLTTDLDVYYYAYQLPPFKVKNKEWNILFDKTYNLCLKKGLVKDYDTIIAQINRLVLAEALVEKKENIQIEDYIDNLYYLRLYGIKPKECLLVQKEIFEEINKCEIIDLEKVKKKRYSKN